MTVERQIEPTHEELIARLDDPMWLLRRAYHILEDHEPPAEQEEAAG
ncbi:MAG TPA: hypothetical protein VMV09_02100 [Candidatus Saccharimonadales bacterium]|nr:hypothetical protein [Candidatus Saccharimonadales bacterium]